MSITCFIIQVSKFFLFFLNLVASQIPPHKSKRKSSRLEIQKKCLRTKKSNGMVEWLKKVDNPNTLKIHKNRMNIYGA